MYVNCRYGEWALITGSTDGIGRAMTVQLARKKINVVIVGRSPTKLEEFSKELTSKYKVQVSLQKRKIIYFQCESSFWILVVC